MKKSTSTRLIKAAACVAGGALCTVSLATTALQDSNTNVKKQKVFVSGEASTQDGGRYIYNLKTGDAKANNGIYWIQDQKAGDEEITFFTEGGANRRVAGDQKGIYFLNRTVTGDGNGNYFIFAPGHDGGQTYSWIPAAPGMKQNGDGLYFLNNQPRTSNGLSFFDSNGRATREYVHFMPKQNAGKDVQVWADAQDSDKAIQYWINAQDGDAKSESIEVQVVDDDITVKINGKQIPAERIKRKDGRIIILDDNGDELKQLNVFINSDKNAFTQLQAPEWRQFMGDELQFSPFTPMKPMQVEMPKVVVGIHMDAPGAALRKHLRLDDGEGVMVIGVLKGLPAERAGIGEFDVIVSVDGDAVADGEALRAAIASHEPGDTIELEVIQSGRKRAIEVQIEAYDAERMANAEVIGSVSNGAQNLWWTPEGNQPFGEFEFDNGRWLVAPDGEDVMRFQVPRDLSIGWRDATSDDDGESDAADKPDTDSENQLNRLDERIAELEQLLDRLIEQAKRDGGRN